MRKGFTLSEVLITLVVVGIVAVLTVPAVMKNYRNRMYVAQLEKVHAQISDAVQAIMSDEHVDNYYETSAGRPNTQNDAGEYITGPAYLLNNYLKSIKKDCGAGSDNPCVADEYKTVDGDAIPYAMGDAALYNAYCIQTTNGATVCMRHNPNNGITSIDVDVNGPSEPNIVGRDAFAMDVRRDGLVTDFLVTDLDKGKGCSADLCTHNDGEELSYYACGCLNAVMQAGWKMDY